MFIFHKKERNDGNDDTSHPCGNYQFECRPSWFAQSLRVIKGEGLNDCRGSLSVLDRGPDGQRQYNITWKAEYLCEENWEVVVQPGFDSDQAVDFELRQLVQNKLKAMMREGILSKAPIKQTHDDQSRPLAPATPPTPAEPSKPPVSPPLQSVAVNTTTIKTTSASGSSDAYDSSAANRELSWLLMSSGKRKR